MFHYVTISKGEIIGYDKLNPGQISVPNGTLFTSSGYKPRTLARRLWSLPKLRQIIRELLFFDNQKALAAKLD